MSSRKLSTLRIARADATCVVDLCLVALLSIPTLFLELGRLPLVLWDESRLSIAAYEMSQRFPSITTTFMGQSDTWSMKPPLMIWLIAGAYSLFGVSEWSLRLPSALAALATAWLVYWFCRDLTRSRLAGLAGALVLLTTQGFAGIHVARTGDYDALLVFFTTATFVCAYLVLVGVQRPGRPSGALLVCFSAALTGAILTKGVAGLLILPGIALAGLLRLTILKAAADWRLWVAAGAPFVVAGAYYVAREHVGPGYLQAVWANEIGGRFGRSLEGHDEPAMFYVNCLLGATTGYLYLPTATPWSWLAALALPLGLRDARLRHAVGYLVVVLVAFVVILSSAQTRISWYVAPAYPLIACLLTVCSFGALRSFQPHAGASAQTRSAFLLFALFAIVSGTTGDGIVQKHRHDVARAETNPELQPAAFLSAIARSETPATRVRILGGFAPVPSMVEPYAPQEHFYAAEMRGRGIDAQVVPLDYAAQPGEVTVGCGEGLPREALMSGVVQTVDQRCARRRARTDERSSASKRALFQTTDEPLMLRR